MKKHLIAAAVAGAFAVPAMAQNVTISGTLDVSAYSTQKLSANASAVGVGAAQSGVKSSGTGLVETFGSPGAATSGQPTGAFVTNTLNFTASEDLGGGLRVTAFLNQSINQANGVLDARDRWISLQGGFGSFQVGRYASHLNNVIAAWTSGTTNTPGSLGGFITGTIPGTGLALGGGSFSRGTNVPTIRYTTPNMSGFVASADVSRGITQDIAAFPGESKTERHTVNLSYSAGPISAVAAWGKVERETEATGVQTVGARNKADALVVGASYDLGMARVSYARMDREDQTANANASAFTRVFDGQTNTIRVIIPAGALTLDASLYDGKDKSAAAGTNIDLDGYQLSARYALSKRTYGYFVTGQNKAKATATGVSASIKSSGSAVGIVHSF